LPEAHVEASTVGSVILASIILKLAVYAFLRFLFGFFYFVFLDLSFLVILIAFVSFFFSSLMALTQVDIKKIIAYSSVAHMIFCC
jgi:NADH-quinone oxidoreductase subunit M